jgi:hypothetical protein
MVGEGYAAARLQMKITLSLSGGWSITLITVSVFRMSIGATAIAATAFGVLGQAPGVRVPSDPSCRGGRAGKSPASASCR